MLGQLVQFVLLGVIAVIAVHVALRRRRGEIGRGVALAWLAFWALAALAVVFQSLTTELAHRLGVGRGVDVVIYFSLVAIFYILFRVLVKIERLNRDVSELVRQMAIEGRLRRDREGREPTPPAAAAPPS